MFVSKFGAKATTPNNASSAVHQIKAPTCPPFFHDTLPIFYQDANLDGDIDVDDNTNATTYLKSLLPLHPPLLSP